jgi:signal transduction histidine kinase
VVGILQMSATQKLRAISWGNLVRPLGAVALVLFLVAIASFPLSRRISRPIEQLTAASRRLGAGELGYRIPLPDWCAQPGPATLGRRQRPRHRHPRDELHELLHTWNDMADRIERLVHGQRELLANISHELRSPLTRVRVALALLPLEGEGENRLREVEADLGELERLIEDVLMTSRLQAIGLPTRPSAVDLRPLLSQVSARASHDPLCSGHSVAVAEGPDLTLHADGTLLKRALFNLVQNGAKYGASPIVISAVTVGDNVEISVSDEGDGIPPEELARVLEPFYRIDKARTPSSSPSLPSVSHGFGLGLTLAKQVALAHGGTITISPLRDEAAVRAGLGKRGCKVTLSLPVGG